MAKNLRLILGDQLNHAHSWFKEKDQDTVYVMMEVMQEQEYVKHHIQKITGFFLAMRQFAEELKDKGHQVAYYYLDDNENQQNFIENLSFLIQKFAVEKFEYQIPDEYRLAQEFKTFAASLAIPTTISETEHFYTSNDELKDFFEGKKQYLMENFYRYMRKKHHILVDHLLEPLGGQWNFDHENRKKYDGKTPLKSQFRFKRDVTELVKMLEKMKVPFFGKIEPTAFSYPICREDALQILAYFCEELLPAFGKYEDAMLKEHQTLFHSCLSFALNLKMISPQEVVDKVVDTWMSNKETIDIAQVEGFVRQVIGWREYMRGIYWAKMPEFAELNYLENKNPLPTWFWDGKVKMSCLNHCINDSLENAYAHHIQRLMVIGNFALLAGCDPDEIDQWYLGVYADATEWVQITNTRGMSQFADGGIIGSKPYVASANYINKMSNYCKGCHYDKDQRYGEKACPFNSLYWNFYLDKEKQLKKNQRVSMMYRLIEKMDPSEIEKIKQQAAVYLRDIDNL